ncbi:dihydroneopterin aldolase [Ehrlichia ruminantium]|uniref:dihydroneopterin aldolase n=1 Tax=Ehrlichia ruminantium TaxID=779 RepID=A0AAE6Q8X1_EHRRU|nr:dihydroneopterin aldolase [Ehrlichia ruminantium]QGR02477.1 dihydroneopterin aldolase [Ehrlichia ruminantium]QGR03399.1 dihydroneopterin aldolase [Ehrlichia ruminantium]QGR04326.1 dihydroneopterin aldolase [Ehrlichia ruminantium]
MKIQISDLIIFSQIGIHSWEKVLKQKLIINCDITLKSYNTICDLNDIINYAEFVNGLINFVSSKQFSLLETVALELMDYIMRDDKIIHCYLKIHKCLACGKNANISVELQRSVHN